MMVLEVESFTSDHILKALIAINEKFHGRYYTIEEISRITGVSVDQMQRVLNARSDSPIWASVRIQKSRPVRLEKGSCTVTYYCPYSASVPVPKNAMQSAEDRASFESRQSPYHLPPQSSDWFFSVPF
jgi:hypothetical protein